MTDRTDDGIPDKAARSDGKAMDKAPKIPPTPIAAETS